MRRLVLLPVTLGALALTPTAAHAGWNLDVGWTTKTGNVACVQERTGRGAIRVRCHNYDQVSSTGRTTWIALRPTGRPYKVRGLVWQGEGPTQPYNRTWWISGGTPRLTGGKNELRCRVSPARGQVCRNRSGRGFVIRKGHITRF